MIEDGVKTKKVSDRYEILNELGRGGMGVVYRARDLKLGRTVALKRILDTHNQGVGRFLQEARTIAKLNHSNIVTVHDTGEDEIGPWLVMEYVKGGKSLEDLLEEEGALPEERVVSIGLALCRALSYAHRMGIIHRDVKPGNVLIAMDGTLKLSDFGLAREGRGSDLSKSGYGMGTGGFAAPEQMKDAKNVDHRADIYGLGALLFQVSTGKRPHVIKEGMIPLKLRPIILKALAESPEDRFFDINEMGVKLSVVLEKPKKEKRRFFSFTTFLALIIITAALAAAAYFGNDYLQKKQARAETSSELFKLINDEDSLKWDSRKVRAAQTKLESLRGSLQEEDLPNADSFAYRLDKILNEAMAIEELEKLQKERVLHEGNEEEIRKARATLSGIKERLPKDFDPSPLDQWYDEKLKPYEKLSEWENRKKEISGSEKGLRSLFEELKSWEEIISKVAQSRYTRIEKWIVSELEPFEMLNKIDGEWDQIKGDEAPMRAALETLLAWEKPLPEEAKGQFDRLKSLIEEELAFYDALASIEKKKSELEGDEQAMSKALEDLQSWESRIPDKGRDRYNALLAYIHGAQGRFEGLGTLSKMEEEFKKSSLEERKKDISGSLDALQALQAKLGPLGRQIPSENQDRFTTLLQSIDKEIEYLRELQAVKPYLEQPASEFEDSLEEARVSLRVFVKKYENVGNRVMDMDVASARRKIEELESEQEKIDRQEQMLGVIFGSGSSKERLSAAKDFLEQWPDHDKSAEVKAKIPMLEELEETEKFRANLLDQGFKYKTKKLFSCGEKSYDMEIFTHVKTNLEFVLIPGGRFTMGSPKGESNHNTDEEPLHDVTIKQFLLCRTEVTQGVWERIMKTSPWKGKEKVREGPDYPATYITWDECDSFCQNTGLRLPSEAEWEYACRAGKETAYCVGDQPDELDAVAWYRDNTPKDEDYPHPVGGKNPNAFGLYDMHGNVYEWCQDVWHNNYSGAPDDGSAWEEEGQQTHRVSRGGSWIQSGRHSRSANRIKERKDLHTYSLGFRPAISLK